MYLDLVFTYVRDLALAHVRPDPSFCVSPCTVPDAAKGTTYTWRYFDDTFFHFHGRFANFLSLSITSPFGR